jgi:protoporphyrinogen oxidase
MNGSAAQIPRVAVIGAGFTGLVAAYELAKAGFSVTVLEQDSQIGGLAGTFVHGDVSLERFYHHWFTNDTEAIGLVEELGLTDKLLSLPSRTGMYCQGQWHPLSRPLDVLRLKLLAPWDRLRLAGLFLRARSIRDWTALENETAEHWVRALAGPQVYRILWEPLLRAKFGPKASDVSAVWLWNKLRLRAGSRRGGGEILMYLHGGLQRLLDRLVERISRGGGRVETNAPVTGLTVADGRVTGVQVRGRTIPADRVIATPALPIVADIAGPHISPAYAEQLRQIEYAANLCLILELTKPLSDFYWLTVNDAGFPYVGIIEHTNLLPSADYGGRHMVYLSRYTNVTDPWYELGPEELLVRSTAHIQRLFPTFRPDTVVAYHLYKARYAQPIVTKLFSSRIPSACTPLKGLFVASMAQIYPEDRGTNYAIRLARNVAGQLVADVRNHGRGEE